jgi:hypothetical protein
MPDVEDGGMYLVLFEHGSNLGTIRIDINEMERENEALDYCIYVYLPELIAPAC